MAKWRGIHQALEAAIIDGTYPPGELIPSIRELMATHDVAKNTIETAITALVEQGLVTREWGVGVRVVSPLPRNDPPSPQGTRDQVTELRGRVTVLEAQVAELRRRLGP